MNEHDTTFWGGVVASAGAALLYLRRRLSADSRILREDEAAKSYIQGIEDELKTAREALETAQRERQRQAEEMGSLRAQVEFLQRANTEHIRRIEKLERLLGLSIDSGPGELDESAKDRRR